jgi:predicted nicotinamide N-methyase
MQFSATNTYYLFCNNQISVSVPNNEELQVAYQTKKINFPFWAKIWPAAEALLLFLEKNIAFIKNKKIVEIGGGIGLPSLVCSQYATSVVFTDYEPLAIHWFLQQKGFLTANNITAKMYNWNLPLNINGEVYILSDVNYNIQNFEAVQKLLKHLLNNHKTVIISTPERIVAKQFILPFTHQIIMHTRFCIGTIDCSVLVLHQ